VILAINTDFREPVLAWGFFAGDFYLAYSLVLDVLGLALVLGLAPWSAAASSDLATKLWAADREGLASARADHPGAVRVARSRA
jgi:hypothetical protein